MSNRKKILFNTQFHWPYAPVDYSLAMSLKQRNNEVLMLACGGGLPHYCELQNNKQQRPDCDYCQNKIVSEFNKYDLPYTTIESLIEQADIDLANKLFMSLSFEELIEFNLSGVPIGKVAWFNLFQYYHSYPFNIDKEKENTYRKIFHSGVIYTLAKERLLKKFNPDIVITTNGKFLQWSPFVYLCQNLKKKYVTWEDLGQKGSRIILEVNGIAHEQRIDKIWEKESKIPITEIEEKKLQEYFNSWGKGELTIFKYGDHSLDQKDEILKEVGIKDDKPIVSLFPNVSWDSSSVGFEKAFNSMYDWIFSSIEYAEKNKEINVIVRIHPAEVKLPQAQYKMEVQTIDAIMNFFPKLPENVKIIPADSRISSYKLAEISEVCMVYTSTMGVELSAKGRKIWVAANAYYAGKGFTLDIESKEHFYRLLQGGNFEKYLTEEEHKLAVKFASIVRLRRIFPFPFLDAFENKFNFPGIEYYNKGSNQILDNICNYIINDASMLDIEGNINSTEEMKNKDDQNSNIKLDELGIVKIESDISEIYQLAIKERFKNRVIAIGDLKFAIYDLMSFYIAFKDIYLHKIYQFTSVNPEPKVIDGGAHIGLFTLFTKLQYPQARVIAFEPEPLSLKLFKHNLKINNIKDVEIIEAGLLNYDGEINFGSDNSDGSSIFAEEADQKINVLKLSNYLNEPVDFLKLNIEGAELKVLEEIEEKLSNVKELVIEYHGFPEIGQNLHPILEILDRNEFRYIIHDFDKETNPATKPPFTIDKSTRYFLLIFAKNLRRTEQAKNKIQLKKKDGIQWSRKSRFDENGRLFEEGGRLFRAMRKYDKSFYETLFKVVADNEILKDTIVATKISDKNFEGFSCILEHEQIIPVAYPDSWSISMFMDALIKHIEVNIELFKNGYTLQDAHLWNMLFDGSKPKFIDLGSIVPFQFNLDLLAKEYLDFGIRPLVLMILGGFEKGRRYLKNSSTPNLTDEDIIGYLVKNEGSEVSKAYYEIINLFAQTRNTVEDYIITLSKINKIIATNLQLNQESTWTVYHQSEENEQIHGKRIFFDSFFEKNKNKTLLDVGCAAGFYSYIAAQAGLKCVAVDIDQPAIDYTYKKYKNENLQITPLCENVFDKHSILSGQKYEVVLALAIIHHLCFTQRMDLSEVVSDLEKYCKEYLVIEFIDENDQFVKTHIQDYRFEYTIEYLIKCLKEFFVIEEIIDSTSKNRKLIVCKKRTERNIVSNVTPVPVSRLFGYDRGTPIDRFFIEKFLENNATLIKGNVLEISENTYTQKFGSGVVKSEVLNYEPSENATIIGDFASGKNIPQNTFNCIILTQTIYVIYDYKSAIKNAYNALAPGGVMLITTPGISQISRYDMDRWGDYWRFTTKSLEEICKDVIPGASYKIESYGNVKLAQAFLDGISYEEIDKTILSYNDPDYQMLLTMKIQKPFASSKKNLAKGTGSNVLLYHRVADLDYDYNLLAVSPKNFEEQLKVLKNNYDLLSTTELLQKIKSDSLTGNEVALTFDDGYYDNYENALPLLEKYSIPSTIFVTTGFVQGNRNSWWDELEYIFLGKINLPNSIKLGDNKFDISSIEKKIEFLNLLLELLREKEFEEISNIIDYIFNELGLKPAYRTSDRFMSEKELKEINKSKLITIASHSITHTRLSILDLVKAEKEIAGSKNYLEDLTGESIDYFSYPFGTTSDYSEESVKLIKKADYKAAFSNFTGVVSGSTNLFEIPRYLVRNWDSSKFSKWLTAQDRSFFEQGEIENRRLYFS